MATFSSAERCGKKLLPCVTHVEFARVRREALPSVNAAVPLSADSSPPTMESKVDLPDPDGPTTHSNSPAETVILTSRNTFVRPSVLVTFRTSNRTETGRIR